MCGNAAEEFSLVRHQRAPCRPHPDASYVLPLEPRERQRHADQAYRGQYQIEKGWSRLKGKRLSLEPMYLQDETRMQGLVQLLMLAVRVLTLLEWQVREKLRESGETLKGIYPGQSGRQTRRPSAELLLSCFAGISLTVVEVLGERSVHVTALTPLQTKLLELWGLPTDLFHKLPQYCAEPPPVLGER